MAWVEKTKNECKFLVGNGVGKHQHGWPRKISDDNIEMDLWEIVCKEGEWLELAQDRIQWQTLW